MKSAYVLIFDDYADWELGNVLAELRRMGKVKVVTIGFSKKPVISMGGLSVQPDLILSEIKIDDILIFILPGGYMWEGSYPFSEIHDLLNCLENRNIPVAAICAATTVLAKAGILKEKKHTSNSLNYMMKIVPEYSEHNNYVNSLSVNDRHLITASGLGSIDFTKKILEELNLATPEIRTLWYDAFKNGKYPDNMEHGV
jgi:putative intracellular protease/amidase